MKPKFFAFSLVGVLIYAGILFLIGSSFANFYRESDVFTVNDVQLSSSQSGDRPEWIITGSGFDNDTRVVLSADDGNLRALVDSVPLWGVASDHVVYGNHIYVANNMIGLQTLQMEDPYHPVVQKTKGLRTVPVHIHEDNGRLFLTCTREGVRIIEIEDSSLSADKTGTNTVHTDGTPLSSLVDGNILYVATSQDEVQIFDISKLPKTSMISRIEFPGKPLSLCRAGDILFVGTQALGVLTYSIADPEYPELLTTIPTEDSVFALSVDEKALYVGDISGIITSFDIRKPSTPVALGQVSTAGSPIEFALDGNRLYVADSIAGLIVLDISDPTMLSMIGIVDVPGQARAVSVHNNLAYVSSSSKGLQVFDLNAIGGQQGIPPVETSGYANDLLLDGGWLYVADSWGNLKIAQYPAHGGMSSVASLSCGDRIMAVAKKGDNLFLAEGTQGIGVVDVSDPQHPIKTSNLNLPGASMRLAVAGDKLIVAAKKAGIHVVDISDPHNPLLIDTVSVTERALDVATDGRYVYVASGRSGVLILELVDGRHLVQVKQIVQPWPMVHFSWAMAIEEREGFLYVASGEDGLWIVDARKPSEAKIVSSLAFPGMIDGVYVEEQRAFVINPRIGIYLVDISDPEHPRSLGCVIPSGGIQDIQPTGDSLLIANGKRGVKKVLRPKEFGDLNVVGSNQLRIPVPDAAMDGYYNLNASNLTEQKTLHGVLKFSSH